MLRPMSIALAGVLCAQLATAAAPEHYVPGELTVRFYQHPGVQTTSEGVLLGNAKLDELNQFAPLRSIEPLYKHLTTPTEPDLSLDYVLHYDEEVDLVTLAKAFESTGVVEYAEPNWLLPMYRTVNDPDDYRQWYLSTLGAEEAWDILPATPDFSDMIVAIIDSGVDWNHPDLAGHIWVNPEEDADGDGAMNTTSTPGDPDDRDGVDGFGGSEGNGYVDDFYGWDFVDNITGCASGEDCDTVDNNPMDFNGHGTHCSGLAMADTDNGVGVAAVAFDGRIMCLRAGYDASDGTGYVVQNAAAEAIYYARENGAKIISMSFGGSQVLRTPATVAYNSGMLCFHAAGNDDVTEQDQLDRASGMISVAATSSSNCKADFSNYGEWVDVSAPGVNMYCTWFNNTYISIQGTSMACPLAASVAALIWNVAPELTNQEVRARLLGTVNQIDHLSCNTSYAGQLGTGCVNAYNAAYNIRATEIVMGELTVTDSGGDGRYLNEENVNFSFSFDNTGINPTDEVICELSTDDGSVTIDAPTLTLNPVEIAESGSGTMSAHLNAGGNNRYVTFTLSISTANAEDALESVVEIMVGTPHVLLYDDAPVTDLIYSFYFTALKEQGLIFDWYQSESGSFPMMPGTSLDMEMYDTVFYSSGSASSTLNANEQTLLSSWLNADRGLLVSSQYAATDLAGSDFLANVLCAEATEDENASRGVRGLSEGDTPCQGYWLILQGAGGANNQGSPVTGINAINGSEVLFQDNDSDFSTGVIHNNVAFLGFAVEAASGLSTSQTLSDVLGEMLPTLDVEEPVAQLPQSSRLTAVWPNPFNPSTQIAFELAQAAQVNLCVYNLLGQEVARLAEGRMTAGEHRVTFQADQQASGLYLATLVVDGQRVGVQKLVLAR